MRQVSVHHIHKYTYGALIIIRVMGIGNVSYYHKSFSPLINQGFSHISKQVVLFVERKCDISRIFEDTEGAIRSRKPTVGHRMAKINQRKHIDIITTKRTTKY